jgi:hypothetical protein
VDTPWRASTTRKRYEDQRRGGGLDAVQAAALSVAFAACALGVDVVRDLVRAELVPWALAVAS